MVQHVEPEEPDSLVTIYTVYWLGKGESWHVLAELIMEGAGTGGTG
jgi:hypothetical protein